MMLPLMKAPSFEAPRYFAEKASGEMDLLMASLALDMTGLMMIGENYQDSSYAPHAKAAELIMEDEADHEIFASELLGDAVNKFGKTRSAESRSSNGFHAQSTSSVLPAAVSPTIASATG